MSGETGTMDDEVYEPFALWKQPDGRFCFICEAGHRIVTSAPNLDTCPAMIHADGLVLGTGDPFACGADVIDRVIPNGTISLWPSGEVS